MTITVQQIITPVTEEQALTTCLSILDSLGFSASSWQSGSRRRTVVQMFAKLYAQSTVTIADIASGGYNALAKGPWLTLFSDSHYDNQRIDAVRTQGTLLLISAANTPGPQSIAAKQLVFADNIHGYTYRNLNAFTLNVNASHSITIEADVAQAAGDVAVNTITEMKTPIVGCTVNNPAIGSTGTWITLNGADQESDLALSERNRTKWGTLGIAPGIAYAYYARLGHASVRRVYVDDSNPRGPGTIDVYVASDSGPVAAGVVSDVTDYMDGTADGVEKIATTADLLVFSAAALGVTVSAQVYILAQYNNATTYAAIEAAVAAYFKDLPIGGTRLTTGGVGAVRIGSLYAAILQVTGVQNVAFLSPTADVAMTASQVAVPTFTPTYFPV